MTIDTTSPVLPASTRFSLWFKLGSDGMLTQPRSRTLTATSEAQAIRMLLCEWPHAVDIEVSPVTDRAPPPLAPAPIFLRAEPSTPVGRSRDPGARGTERPSTRESRGG